MSIPGVDASVYQDGIRFECQASGKCCHFRSGYSHVYVSLAERRRLATLLKMRTSTFTRTYCVRSGDSYELRADGDACIFLRENMCSVYEARPVQCSSWPFWPENMTRKAWRKEVVSFCPGVGRGRLHEPGEIEEILTIQVSSDG